MKKLNEQEIIDIIYGCTILGTGGGGDLDAGLSLVQKSIDEGRNFTLASIEDIPEESYVAVPYVCGAISPLTEVEEKKYENLPTMEITEAMRAYQTMEEYFGEEFAGVVATELGGENTADAFHIAAQLDKYIVDGDPAGRSVPELQHTTYFINDVPITPMALATPFGDTIIINNVVNDFRAEALVRSLAVVSRNTIGVVDHPTRVGDLKKAIIPGTISYSLQIGKTLRESVQEGRDPATAITENNHGRILFRGKVDKYNWETIDGFTIGEVVLDGIGEYAENSYRVWFKNEHIASYLNGRVDVSVPDLICIIDKNGVPVTNPKYEEGMELVVFALPAPKEWVNERGLEVFGPRSFGLDFDYKPFKK